MSDLHLWEYIRRTSCVALLILLFACAWFTASAYADENAAGVVAAGEKAAANTDVQPTASHTAVEQSSIAKISADPSNTAAGSSDIDASEATAAGDSAFDAESSAAALEDEVVQGFFNPDEEPYELILRLEKNRNTIPNSFRSQPVLSCTSCYPVHSFFLRYGDRFEDLTDDVFTGAVFGFGFVRGLTGASLMAVPADLDEGRAPL